ncbi:unnamed protein product [Clonostachys solani]|uniref:Rhodopsin domain-containing protein n=1 Tax=Clonostachys solani TaxID=160281 RepID=A0A9P0EF95_9HYPO|nr:unnamed protein product [Clonostachys solani]
MSSTEYIGWRIDVLAGVLTPLQILCVGLRFYSHRLSGKKYDWDDWLILANLFTQLVLAGMILGVVHQGGVGYHVEYHAERDPETLVIYFKYLAAIPIWYSATINLSKLAILAVYKRLFPQRRMHICIWVLAGILVVHSIVGVILLFTVCRPFWANWGSLEVQNAHCYDRIALFLWYSLPSIITDVILILLPLPVVWKLQLTSKLKIALTVTFLIGGSDFHMLSIYGSGLLASIMRFRGFAENNLFPDFTWTATVLMTWTLVEPSIYLISACFMMYRPLLERVVRVAKNSTIRSTTGAKGTSKSLNSTDAIEMGHRSQVGSHGHRFERLYGEGDEEALRPTYDPAHIHVRTDIDVSKA